MDIKGKHNYINTDYIETNYTDYDYTEDEYIVFDVGYDQIIIPREIIPENSALEMMCRRCETDTGIVINDSELPKVLDYLQTDRFPITDNKLIEKLDYYGVYLWSDYDLIYSREKFMRDNMYNSDLDHPIHQDNFHNLIKIEDIFSLSKLINKGCNKRDNLLFDGGMFKAFRKEEHDFMNQYNIYFTQLERYTKKLFEIGGNNVYVAGGYIFNLLTQTDNPSSDIDIFFVNCSEERAIKIMLDFCETLSEENLYIQRSNNAISLRLDNKIEYQFILRIYKTFSELLHGFDIDCCCTGYDGENIWITERCMYSLYQGYNTVNLNLLSPSYEYRLMKYGNRGIPVYIPGFDPKFINQENFDLCYYSTLGLSNIRSSYSVLRDSIHKLSKAMYNFDEELLNQMKQSYDKMDEMFHKCCDFRRNNNINMKGLELLLCMNRKYKSYDPSVNYWVSDYHYKESGHDISTSHNIRIMGIYNVILYKNYSESNLYYISCLVDNCSDSNILVELPVYYILEAMMQIHDSVYEGFKNRYNVHLDQHIKFKKLNPGEQMTGTFNKLVLENNDMWYSNSSFVDEPIIYELD